MAEFPCRASTNDSLIVRPFGTKVIISAGNANNRSFVLLSPEDVLQFAQAALEIADGIAERELP